MASNMVSKTKTVVTTFANNIDRETMEYYSSVAVGKYIGECIRVVDKNFEYITVRTEPSTIDVGTSLTNVKTKVTIYIYGGASE